LNYPKIIKKQNRYLAMHNQIASFRAALDARPVSRYQWLLLILLALLLVTDGYDAQVLGYVVPALAQDWGLEKSAFGPVFSANLLGLTLGSLAVTPLADRFGVRRILLACVLIYATLTVLMVFADSLNTLMIARFICGIGMGGAMPSAMALMSEYSPPRLRTLDGDAGGVWLLVRWRRGWFRRRRFYRPVRLASGVPRRWRHAVAAVSVFSGGCCRKSLPRLLRDAPPYARLRKVTSRMLPDWQPPVASVEQNEREQGSKLTVVELFRNGYARPTLLIWATFFVSLILLYFMISWLPTLLLESGLKLNEANLVTSMFLFAGTLGAICMAWFADRLKRKVRLLSAVLAGAALCTILLGLNHDKPALSGGLRLRCRVLHHRRATDAECVCQQFSTRRMCVRPAPDGHWVWGGSVRFSGRCLAACCWRCTFRWRRFSSSVRFRR
jgi:AAHS family 4-hydroxybenzoate transporter-like MFS transporter